MGRSALLDGILCIYGVLSWGRLDGTFIRSYRFVGGVCDSSRFKVGTGSSKKGFIRIDGRSH